MHTKKPLSIGLVAMLLLGMAVFVMPVSAGPAQDIWVELIDGVLDTLQESDEFSISVLINITDPAGPATGLYGWEYKLKWNATWLKLISTAEPDLSTDLGWPNGDWVKKNVIAADNASVWCAANAKSPDPAYTGVTWISNYTFHVEKSIFEPDSTRTEYIKMDLVGLVDDQVGDLVTPYSDLTVVTYYICPIPIPKPYFKVVPEHTYGVCQQLFNVSVAICNLYAGWNLWGWECEFKYDPAWVTAMNSYEGPLLPSFVSPPHANATTYINTLNYTANTILTAGSFNDKNHTAPSTDGGCGVVSILEFNASEQTIAPTVVEVPFEIVNPKLVGVYPNDTVYEIPQLKPPENGTYHVPYKVVGWFMDCTTQQTRKKCECPTEYYGEGLNATADSFETQDLVILFAYLEYNFQPESDKIVMFEVYGPNRSISIIRTAITNCSGIATIQFTIPNIPEAFGHWVCYQAAQVKIDQKPEDWLFWKVGWIVEITGVSVIEGPGGWVDPEGASKCEYIEIVVEYKTISFMPCWVLFTAVVLDELLDPICEVTWWVYVYPTEPVLCSERNDTTSNYCHIPCYTHAGEATVYVNAFTDFPMLCGCPFCPEATANFWVIASPCPCE